MSYSVVVSTLVTAAVQAAAALVGFLIARVPHPVFFAIVTFFCAMIPAIGGAAVCLMVALILLATGHPYMAVFLSIWGLLVVGLIDNAVKPLILKGGMHISAAVVFFALVGGLAAFGIMGYSRRAPHEAGQKRRDHFGSDSRARRCRLRSADRRRRTSSRADHALSSGE